MEVLQVNLNNGAHILVLIMITKIIPWNVVVGVLSSELYELRT